MGAKRRFMTWEKLIRNDEFLKEGSVQTLLLNRTMVDGVIETPRGAHFTEYPPDYGRDEAFQREYAASAKDAGAWQSFFEKYLSVEDEAAYQRAVASFAQRAQVSRSEPQASEDH